MHFDAVYWEKCAFKGQVHLSSNSDPATVLQVPTYKNFLINTVGEGLRTE